MTRLFDLRQRNRRLGMLLAGWIVLLAAASLAVIWIRN